MIITLTPETKRFPTHALHSHGGKIITFNAIITVYSRTALIRLACVCKKFTYLLFILMEYFFVLRGRAIKCYRFN